MAIAYEYKNAPIPGGGYVTGFAFHKKEPGILYARTDIGGVYRYLYDERRWKSLADHVTMMDIGEVFPIAIALDDKYPNRLYAASGVNGEASGKLSISEDYGETFFCRRIPTMVHGNLSGRGVGMRLVVDENDSDVLYFASQTGGLLRTGDRGESWEKLPVPEDYMTFVWVSPDSRTIVAGTAGLTAKKDDKHRGHSLYVSYDGGDTFCELMEPESYEIGDCKMNGLVASRYDYDGKYLYVTMNSTGRFNYIVDLGYSCDTGDVIGGRVLRYFFENGKIAGYEDITPGADGGRAEEYVDYGFGGICSCPSEPGLLACSTLCRELKSEECIYISRDYGEHWEVSLSGLKKGGIYFNTSYMKPEYNGKVSILHWQSDVKINPFNKDEIWLNSGTGVFGSEGFTTENPAYHDISQGIEETVHLNVYAPLAGEVKLLDIVGDLGAFAFTDLDTPCRNSFDDAEGNRYITCINGDLSDTDEKTAIVTARGNWKRKTKGGLVRTRDGYRTFERLPMPFGINEKIDEKLRLIEEPNVNAGWVAMSPDCKNIVWSIADNIELPVSLAVSSQDGGESFDKVMVYDKKGLPVADGKFKSFSDRVDSSIFYGFGESSQLYVSRDGGKSFYEKEVKGAAEPAAASGFRGAFPAVDFGQIDTANKTEIRVEGGRKGSIYLALGKEGLWRLEYDQASDLFLADRLTKEGDQVFRAGLGVGRPGGDYLREPKMIYLCGVINGEYGFFRSEDQCASLERINNEKQMYGDINSIDGDKREFGRFFIATGSRGVIYGQEKRGKEEQA